MFVAFSGHAISFYMRGSRGGRGKGSGPPSPTRKITKNKGFLSNTGPDPLKTHKSTKPAFAGGQMVARF